MPRPPRPLNLCEDHTKHQPAPEADPTPTCAHLADVILDRRHRIVLQRLIASRRTRRTLWTGSRSSRTSRSRPSGRLRIITRILFSKTLHVRRHAEHLFTDAEMIHRTPQRVALRHVVFVCAEAVEPQWRSSCRSLNSAEPLFTEFLFGGVTTIRVLFRHILTSHRANGTPAHMSPPPPTPTPPPPALPMPQPRTTDIPPMPAPLVPDVDTPIPNRGGRGNKGLLRLMADRLRSEGNSRTTTRMALMTTGTSKSRASQIVAAVWTD